MEGQHRRRGGRLLSPRAAREPERNSAVVIVDGNTSVIQFPMGKEKGKVTGHVRGGRRGAGVDLKAASPASPLALSPPFWLAHAIARAGAKTPSRSEQ